MDLALKLKVNFKKKKMRKKMQKNQVRSLLTQTKTNEGTVALLPAINECCKLLEE